VLVLLLGLTARHVGKHGAKTAVNEAAQAPINTKVAVSEAATKSNTNAATLVFIGAYCRVIYATLDLFYWKRYHFYTDFHQLEYNNRLFHYETLSTAVY